MNLLSQSYKYLLTIVIFLAVFYLAANGLLPFEIPGMVQSPRSKQHIYSHQKKSMGVDLVASAFSFGSNSANHQKLNHADIYNYGIVIDCGSSGSRVFVYKWDPLELQDNIDKTIRQITAHRDRIKEEGGKVCHEIDCPVVKKVEPGISDYISSPEKAADQMEDLLNFADNFIPKAKKQETVLYIYATAGLRMEKASERTRLLSIIRRRISKNFLYQLENPDVISGESEGLYAYIAINSIKGTLCPEKSHQKQKPKSVAVMDMGGGSLQIVIPMNESQVKTMNERFQDKTDILASSLNTHIEKIDYLTCGTAPKYVFIKTWLGIGANKARRRYEDYILKEGEVDPCVNEGLTLNGITGVQGDFEKCRARLAGRNIFDTHRHNSPEDKTRDKGLLDCLYKAPSTNSDSVPGSKKVTDLVCGHEIDSRQLPEIDFLETELIGLSEFFYTTEDTFQMSGSFDAEAFHRRASDWCRTANVTKVLGPADSASENGNGSDTKIDEKIQDAEAAAAANLNETQDQTNDNTQPEGLYEKFSIEHAQKSRIESQCFKAAWISTVLYEGLGFPILNKNKFRLTAIDRYERQDLQWTLGALIHQVLKGSAREYVFVRRVAKSGWRHGTASSKKLPDRNPFSQKTTHRIPKTPKIHLHLDQPKIQKQKYPR